MKPSAQARICCYSTFGFHYEYVMKPYVGTPPGTGHAAAVSTVLRLSEPSERGDLMETITMETPVDPDAPEGDEPEAPTEAPGQGLPPGVAPGETPPETPSEPEVEPESAPEGVE